MVLFYIKKHSASFRAIVLCGKEKKNEKDNWEQNLSSVKLHFVAYNFTRGTRYGDSLYNSLS